MPENPAWNPSRCDKYPTPCFAHSSSAYLFSSMQNFLKSCAKELQCCAMYRPTFSTPTFPRTLRKVIQASAKVPPHRQSEIPLNKSRLTWAKFLPTYSVLRRDQDLILSQFRRTILWTRGQKINRKDRFQCTHIVFSTLEYMLKLRALIAMSL